MKSLETRIAALERVTHTTDDLTIIRRVVTPGEPVREITRLCADDGTTWTRQTGESEQALIDRASLEVMRSPLGVGCLVAEGVEVCHAEP